jgi:hypothetical protein
MTPDKRNIFKAKKENESMKSYLLEYLFYNLSGVKRPGRGVDHPPPSSTEVKERVELYLYSPSGPS